MLYKKYHRNFVKQFKKGTKIAIGSGESYYSDKVIGKPLYMYNSIYIGDSKYLWILVLPSGKTNKHIYVV